MIPVLCITAFMIAGESTGFIGLPVRAASLASLIVIVLYFLSMAKKDAASPVLKTMVIFLALEAAGVWLLPQEPRVVFGKLAIVLLYTLLFAMAVIPLIGGKAPFTTFFAKKDAPEEVWETDIFKQINKHMTKFWAFLFVVCGLFALTPLIYPFLDVLPWSLVFRLGLPALLLAGLGRAFNKKYPDYYMKKIGPAPQETPAPE
ncbi:hypothetical protein SAMN02745216_02437 [Desulfatibacillum alkenivorans DSM 16219]|jgi:hypothetical protein|uniref:Intracellular septation protein A n=1 Tax=Desulfatibacillum alkenivorans DSM 16219 TaxID=1121393 RepID=A0A1M6MTR4_9BACT|nr:hypothetical protein [Desulfatibacillum alkenivorans]SHJ86847.1 hypothetical protein SAMN02745216_02437 [Desulfatibacillum alkenivorans DSM 16219]